MSKRGVHGGGQRAVEPKRFMLLYVAHRAECMEQGGDELLQGPHTLRG